MGRVVYLSGGVTLCYNDVWGSARFYGASATSFLFESSSLARQTNANTMGWVFRIVSYPNQKEYWSQADKGEQFSVGVWL